MKPANNEKDNNGHDESQVTSTNMSSLWLSIASSVSSSISYENASEYFLKLVENYLHVEQHSRKYSESFKDDSILISNGLSDTGEAKGSGSPVERGGPSKIGGSDPHLEEGTGNSSASDPRGQSTLIISERGLKGYKIKGVDIIFLTRLFVNSLIKSYWNGPDPDTLSISGLEAYLRPARTNVIERKLKYSSYLHKNCEAGGSNLLVRVFFSDVKDQIMILAYDPLSNELFTLKIQEDISAMPCGEELSKLFEPYRKYEQNILNCMASERKYLCSTGISFM